VDHASAIESDKADLPQSIAVRAASGDRAAVDIGRFLILQVSADAVTTDAPVSAGVSDHRVSVSPARHIGAHGAPLSQTSGTIADIFGASVESTIPNDIAARVLSAGSARGVQHATLQLDPPELGQMRIDIRLREHGMTLRIDADHLAAARMIESRVSELRDSLAAHGIRVERCEVTLRPPEAPHANSGQDDGRSSSGDGEAHSRQHSSQWLDDGRRFAGSRDDGPRDDAGFGLLGGRPADGSTDGDRLESARLGFMANGVVNLVA
jgi:flagellar hook-length control protein FliK